MGWAAGGRSLIELEYHCKYDLHPTTLEPDLRDGDAPSTHILRTYLWGQRS